LLISVIIGHHAKPKMGETPVVNSHAHFVWYELITTDVESAKAFYTRVMGWGTWDASAPGRPYTVFTVGNASVGGLMELPADVRKMGAKPSWIGYVGVNDVDATTDRIQRLGGVVHVPPTNVANISRFSVFSDPQTARLALFKWLKPGQDQRGKPDAMGCVGWHELLAADPEMAFAFYSELFGWQKADTDIDATSTYHLFSAGDETIGGMATKPPTMPAPFWLYYFNVSDIDTAAQRVKADGGEIIGGPVEVPGGSWAVQCSDPQGAIFALEGMRTRKPIGYFERVVSRDSSGARGCRWSW
jgi:predicted enzyme related to lactoylglutathione lyase